MTLTTNTIPCSDLPLMPYPYFHFSILKGLVLITPLEPTKQTLHRAMRTNEIHRESRRRCYFHEYFLQPANLKF